MQQSQTDVNEVSRAISDAETPNNSELRQSEIEREWKELNQENYEVDQFLDSDFDKNTINRKILNLNEISAGNHL